MHLHKNTNFQLNNCGRDWFYSLPGWKEYKPLKAASFKEALKEVHRIIEAL